MQKGRLEAFSDGVIAIIITIMVLEMRIPPGAGDNLHALEPILPIFLSYVVSFIYIGIYWSNHHHMLHTVKKVNGSILWANLHLLFWLSLIPFTTSWLGENKFSSLPAALYGVVLLGAALAYFILTKTIINVEGKDSLLAKAIGSVFKEKLSIATYLTAIVVSFISPLLANILYFVVAVMWLVPDKRIEKVL